LFSKDITFVAIDPYSQKSTLLSILFILWSTSENQEGVNVNWFSMLSFLLHESNKFFHRYATTEILTLCTYKQFTLFN